MTTTSLYHAHRRRDFEPLRHAPSEVWRITVPEPTTRRLGRTRLEVSDGGLIVWRHQRERHVLDAADGSLQTSLPRALRGVGFIGERLLGVTGDDLVELEPRTGEVLRSRPVPDGVDEVVLVTEAGPQWLYVGELNAGDGPVLPTTARFVGVSRWPDGPWRKRRAHAMVLTKDTMVVERSQGDGLAIEAEDLASGDTELIEEVATPYDSVVDIGNALAEGDLLAYSVGAWGTDYVASGGSRPRVVRRRDGAWRVESGPALVAIGRDHVLATVDRSVRVLDRTDLAERATIESGSVLVGDVAIGARGASDMTGRALWTLDGRSGFAAIPGGVCVTSLGGVVTAYR